MNPVTVDALKADWADDPALTEQDLAKLTKIPDDQLQDALDAAFRPNEDIWFMVLDSTRNAATEALLEGTE
jgi:hypothetical protein